MPVARSHAAEQRTASGCWTCRLRRLKCDEGTDICCQCSRHGIPCDGYGRDKPEWKDGGIREAKQLEKIKNLISLKRKRDRRRTHETPESGKTSMADIMESPDPSSSVQRSAREINFGHSTSSFDTQHETFNLTQLKWSTEASEMSASPSSTRQDELLIHYLDYVFNLQFRHHKNFSSRSWLFGLVKRIIPLRHSVLSLSALHQYHLHQHGSLGRPHGGTLQELQDHHTATLSELQQFIRDQTSESLSDNHVAILACCVQLISFDLFQGGNTEWHMHLQAATTLIKDHAEYIGPGSLSERQFHQDIASNFCTGAIMWFDILSSATTGKKPSLHTSHQRLLKSRAPIINLKNIMGCENSVMILIGEIAVLQEWKTNQKANGTLNVWSLVDKAKWILEALEREIERSEVTLAANAGAAMIENPELGKDYEVYTATNIFACAALVYLHTVVCGFYQSLPEIKKGVEQTIIAMKRIRQCDKGAQARFLVWPAVIAGSLADEAQEEFFRDFLSAGSDGAHGFGNCHIAKNVLETCWEQSKASDLQAVEVWDWSRAMQHLGYQLLLV